MVVQTRPVPPRDVIELAPRATTDRRLLFDGFVNHPVQAAAAILLLGRVARHRFYLPPGMLAAKIAASDPVVTTSADRLRFESFSACGGMALRFDVLPGGLDTPPVRHGSTNIDVTGPTRLALSGVQGIDPLHLRVTGDAVTFATLDHTAVETEVPLPQRWIRGFAESQAVGAGLLRRATITPAEARAFWRTLPTRGNGTSSLFVAPGVRGLRLTGSGSPTTVPLGGPSRLRLLEPLLRHATSVVVYGPADGARPGASLWQFDFVDGTLSCALSPTASRGFSGEGGLLHHLATPLTAADVAPIAELIDDDHDGGSLVPADLARRLGLTPSLVEAGLMRLAAAGVLGYDTAQQAYFHRDLPWSLDDVEELNPRLVAARKLLEGGAVTIGSDEIVEISHGDSHHRVRGRGDRATCTCPWIAQHGSSRGPCKHILAADLARARELSS